MLEFIIAGVLVIATVVFFFFGGAKWLIRVVGSTRKVLKKTGYRGEEREVEEQYLGGKGKAIIALIIIAIIIVPTALSMFITVPSGTRGILLEWDTATRVLGEGLHFPLVPIKDRVVLMETQIQKASLSDLDCGTSDIQ